MTEPKYCAVCGKELLTGYAYSYNIYTGEKYISFITKTCPERTAFGEGAIHAGYYWNHGSRMWNRIL